MRFWTNHQIGWSRSWNAFSAPEHPVLGHSSGLTGMTDAHCTAKQWSAHLPSESAEQHPVTQAVYPVGGQLRVR